MKSKSSNIIAIIPARGGSKEIPGKNLIDLGGVPLITWTINSALSSGVIDRLIVSTDSQDIAIAAELAGAEVPYIRPQELADDSVHAIQVIFHALDWLVLNEQVVPEGIMMLLPTSPLRLKEDIKGVVNLFKDNVADSVISVVDLGKYMTNLRYMLHQEIVPVDPGENKNAQRQGLSKLYSVNGSIFLARPLALREAGTFHLEGALGYVMDALNSIDINSEQDLMIARTIVKNIEPWKCDHESN